VTVWQAGDVWLGQHWFTLPATLESGTYEIYAQLALSSLDSYAPSPAYIVGQISVVAPVHSFAPPPVDIPVDVNLGGVATLLGVTFDPATCNPQPATQSPQSATCNLQPSTPISLIWRAEETPVVSYRVFLHLLDGEGRIVSQSDGVPVNWSRPTTGWLPGEIIVDERELGLAGVPSGEYTLSTGLYLSGAGRLTAPDGSDSITVCTVILEEP
jgi:hypothetical protein